ncbi:MAG: glycosyltransferase [Bacteroidales bacterium]|nr:glycosyltransferase [Bacteroidales bacterium]
MNNSLLNPYKSNISKGISIITSLKNRSDNLFNILTNWLTFDEVDEIVVVDWSSDESIKPIISKINDSRVFLFEAINQPEWKNVGHASNLAARLATRSVLIKIDTDVKLFPGFFGRHKIEKGLFYSGFWDNARNKNEMHLSGFLMVQREDFFKVNGYCEWLESYGYDDSDLIERLEKEGLKRKSINNDYLYHIPHGNRTHLKNSPIRILDDAKAHFYTQRNRFLCSLKPWPKDAEMRQFDVTPVDSNHAICKQTNILDGFTENLVEEANYKALYGILVNRTYSPQLNRKILKQIHKKYLWTLYELWNAALKLHPAKSTQNPKYCLITAISNTIDFKELIETLNALIRNINHPIVSEIHIVYDITEDVKDNRNYLLKFLKKNNVSYNEINRKATFYDLISYANKYFSKERVIIAKAGVYFDKTLEKVDTYNFNGNVISLTAGNYNNEGKFKLPHDQNGIPEYFSAAAWIFRSPLNLNFNCNFEFYSPLADSYFVKQLHSNSYLKVDNTCLDLNVISSSLLNKEYDFSIDYFHVSKQISNLNEQKSVINKLGGTKWSEIKDTFKSQDNQVFWTNYNVFLKLNSFDDLEKIDFIVNEVDNLGGRTVLIFEEFNSEIQEYIRKFNTNITTIYGQYPISEAIRYTGSISLKNFLINNYNNSVFIDTKYFNEISDSNNNGLNSFKISIITPCLNAANHIENAIESVLSQDYDNYEHIIVDGGSTDETLNILMKYEHLYWVSEPDKGQSDAMNKGFSLSKGDIIVYLNADDSFSEGVFSEVVECFREELTSL